MDSRIALSGQPVNFMLPGEAVQRGLQTNAMAQKNAMADMAMRDKAALDKAYRESGGDISRMRANPNMGFEAGMQIENIRAQQANAAAQAQAAQIEKTLKGMEISTQLLSGANDQATWDAALQEIGGLLGPEAVSRFPKQFDPAARDMLLERAIPLKDRLLMQREELRFDRQMMRDEMRYAQQNAMLERRLAAQGGGDSKLQLFQGEGGAYWVDPRNPTAPPIPIMSSDGSQLTKPESPSEKSARIKQEAEAKVAEKDYQNSLAAAAEAEKLFEKATGSGIGKARDAAYSVFGASTEGAKAAAQLKVVAGKLVAAVPKFSGPQSDADVKLYREMAGQVGDESLPVETRKAALQTVIELQRGEAERRRAGYQPTSTPSPASPSRSIVRSGTLNGRRVVQYSDGTTEYAD